jgi:hypothetical protein
MAEYPLWDPILNPWYVIPEVSFGSTETGSAINSMAAATGNLADGIAGTVDAMLDETVNFTQTTNAYDLAALLDGVDLSVQAPSFSPTSVVIGSPNFEGGSLDYTDQGITLTDPPPMNLVNPDINTPPVPDLSIPAFTGVAPTIDTPTLPARPDYTLPPMPLLSEITIPEPPTYDIPDFEGVMPVFDMTPPDGNLDWAEAGYNSQLKTQLDGKLTNEVTTDQSGLNTNYENGIYDRARSRQEVEHARTLAEGLNYFGTRGIQLPGAALSSIQTEVQNRIVQIRTDLENDIDIQAAKLVDEHTRFVKETAISWEQPFVDYHNKVQDRALEAAQAAVVVMIEVYQTKVEGYKAQMSAYSSMADAYNSRISAELGKAEFYKAQIEGKKMAVDAQSILIEAYTAQVESVFTLADIYAAEMEAARIQAEIDKIKMEAYSVKVRAYRYQVEAMAATFQAYMAQIQGEEAKVQMYQNLVDAYTAQVEGHVSRARVLIADLQVATENLKAQAEIYSAQVRKYQADTKHTVGVAETRVLAQSADNADFESRLQPQIAKMSARGSIYNASAQEKAALETATARMAAATNTATAQLRQVSATIGAATTKAQARKTAANIAKVSVSHNTVGVTTVGGTKRVGKQLSGNNYSSDLVKVGTYNRTYNNS